MKVLLEPPPVGAKVWVDRGDGLIECTVVGSRAGYAIAVAPDGHRCWVAPGALVVSDAKPEGA